MVVSNRTNAIYVDGYLEQIGRGLRRLQITQGMEWLWGTRTILRCLQELVRTPDVTLLARGTMTEFGAVVGDSNVLAVRETSCKKELVTSSGSELCGAALELVSMWRIFRIHIRKSTQLRFVNSELPLSVRG